MLVTDIRFLVLTFCDLCEDFFPLISIEQREHGKILLRSESVEMWQRMSRRMDCGIGCFEYKLSVGLRVF